MRFKKFVGAIGALTVAASVFAGLAVTANAAYSATTVYTNSGGSASNGSNSIDISAALNDVSTGLIRIEYNVNTTVDFSNTGGNRNGTATLTGKNAEDNSVSIISIYANTYKNMWARRYAVGSVATDASSSLDSSQDNSTSHDYYVSLTVDLDSKKYSGTITKMDETPVVTNVADNADWTVASLTSLDLTSSTTANVMTVSGFKVSALTEVSGYLLTTTPYSKVTIGEKAYYSGADGVVDFGDDEIAANSEVTIEKNGYTTKIITADVENGDEETLTPADSAVSYYEDFAYVYDNYGFTAADGSVDGTSVTDGVLKPTVTSGSSVSTVLGKSIDIQNKLLTLDMDLSSRSANNYGDLTLDGTGITFNVRPGYGLRIYGSSGNTGFLTVEGNNNKYIAGRYNFQIKFGDKARIYCNGLYLSEVVYSGTAITGLTETIGKGSEVSSKIYSIKTSLSPTDASVTYVDGDTTGTPVTYLSGTAITTPDAAGKEGYTFNGWSDGTTTYAAGESITLTSAVTLTAQYTETVVAPTLPEADATHATDNTESKAADYVDPNHSSDETKGKASLWNASLTGGADVTITGFKAVVTDNDGKTAEGTTNGAGGSFTNISGSSDISVFVYVNKWASEITSVKITALSESPASAE